MTRLVAHPRPRPATGILPHLITLAAIAAVVPAGATAQSADPGEPRAMPMTVQPQLANPEQAARAMYSVYPPLLRDAGVESVAKVWIYVDEKGRVLATRLNETSGYVAMDEAARKVAEVMRFSPARNGEAVVPAWIVMNIRFALPADDSPPAAPPVPPARATAEPMPTPPPAVPAPAPAPPATLEALRASPALTPADTEPRVLNADQAEAAVAAFYPAALRDAGIGGVPEIWILIDDAGAVVDSRVKTTSGYADMDQAAATVGRTLRFEPATRDGGAVPVWRSIRLRFAAPAAEPQAPAPAEPQPAVAPEPTPPAEPAAPEIPSAARPELQNADVVRQAILENYPPLLRDAGIGGTVEIRVLVDVSGQVTQVEVRETSGYESFDNAARRVGSLMRFSPAVNDGKPVAAWVQLPITFAVDG